MDYVKVDDGRYAKIQFEPGFTTRMSSLYGIKEEVFIDLFLIGIVPSIIDNLVKMYKDGVAISSILKSVHEQNLCDIGKEVIGNS